MPTSEGLTPEQKQVIEWYGPATRGRKRRVTQRVDMVTCAGCKQWAAEHPNALEDDGHGNLVTA